MPSSAPEPPVAKKVDHKFPEHFGITRDDPYYWMRDDDRKNPEVLAYLNSENDYTEDVTKHTKEFQEELFKEMKSRIKEDDNSVPLRKGKFWYYNRQETGKQYPVHCRREILAGEGPGTVTEIILDTETNPSHGSTPNAGPEQILLDENHKAQNVEFFRVGPYKVSPDHTLLAYGYDLDGHERFKLDLVPLPGFDSSSSHVFAGKGAESGLAGDPTVPNFVVASGIDYSLAWAADNKTLFFCTKDKVERPDKVWRVSLGESPEGSLSPVLVYNEEDPSFNVGVASTSSGQFLEIQSASAVTSHVMVLEADSPQGTFREVLGREQGVDVDVTHSGSHFFITRRSDELFNSEILACHVSDTSAPWVVREHRPEVKIEHVVAFERHLAVYERSNGLQSITVFNLPPPGAALVTLGEGQRISFEEEAYSLSPEPSQFKSPILRFGFESLKTPFSVFDYAMDSADRSLKKIEPVLGDFSPENYTTLRRWAVSPDGTRVPISIVYRTDMARLDGSDPLHLYGYGSYEISVDPYFSKERLSLLDRGVTYAIAHVRGGGEMGRRWYEDGKYLSKRNTFKDFVLCAAWLVQNKFASPGKVSIEGRSAGGLLMGAVLNMRPDMFLAAVAGVPFVDVVTTMLDESIPLTTAEWEEWGNPNEKEYFEYMLSYSPVDNVGTKDYPHILVTAGLHDPRVAYWEPAKWVAKLRDCNKGSKKLLLLKCDMGAGHFSKSGRFDKLRERAFEFAFLLGCHGYIPLIRN